MVGFGFNLLVMVMLVVIMVKGHLISFRVKNNLTMFLQIIFALALPIICENAESASLKFYVYIGCLFIVGFLNSFQQGSLYGQASCFPGGS